MANKITTRILTSDILDVKNSIIKKGISVVVIKKAYSKGGVQGLLTSIKVDNGKNELNDFETKIVNQKKFYENSI